MNKQKSILLSSALLFCVAVITALVICTTTALANENNSSVQVANSYQLEKLNNDNGLNNENSNPIRETDVSESKNGCALCYVDGTFGSAGKTFLLNKINSIRREAYMQRSINPDNPSERLKPEDYKPLDGSYEMEGIAQTRACEATINQGHTRTNGQNCFTCTHNGYSSNGESLAGNSTGMSQAIDQWYSEKADGDAQTGRVTGHYTAMIAPKYGYVGMGNFVNPFFGSTWNCTSAEFYIKGQTMDTSETAEKGNYNQLFELNQNYAVARAFGTQSMEVGQSGLFIFDEALNGTNQAYNVYPLDITWTSSNSNVATVDEWGIVNAIKGGFTTIRGECNGTFYYEGNLSVIGATKPVPKLVTTGDGTATIKGEAIDGADGYIIQELENGVGKDIKKTFYGTQYTVEDLANNFGHNIIVQAHFGSGYSQFDPNLILLVTPTGPTVKPSIKNTSGGDRSIALSGNKVPGAKQYAVNGKTRTSGWYCKFVDANTLNSTLTGLQDSVQYTLLVQANIYGTWSSFTNSDLAYENPTKVRPVPELIQLGDGTAKIKGNAVPNADGYVIQERENGVWVDFKRNYQSTEYTVTNLANNYWHNIIVQAQFGSDFSAFSEDIILLVKPEGSTVKPSIKIIEGSSNSINLSWNMVPGAKRYAVNYRTIGGSGNSFFVDANTLSSTISGLRSSTKYECLVQADIYGTGSSFTNTDIKSATTDGSASPIVSANPSGDGQVTLSWNAIHNASKYAIYEMQGTDGHEHPYSLSYGWTDTTYVVNNLSNNCVHKFLVQACVNGSWSPYSSSDFVSATPQGTMKPQINEIQGTQNSISLTGSKVPGASYYAIASKNSDGSFTTYTKFCDNDYYTITGLNDNTSYNVLVQANINGHWSSFDDTDLKKATTDTDKNAVAVYDASSSQNCSLSFYYDKVDHSSEGTVYYIEQKDNTLLPWHSIFSNVKFVNIDSTFKSYYPCSTGYWFNNGMTINSINGISNLNLKMCFNTRSMFSMCNKITSLDISGIDTHNVRDMSSMFFACSNLNSLDLTSLDTSNCRNLSSIFYSCTGLSNLNVSGFDTKNVENFNSVFIGCSGLRNVDISKWNFDSNKGGISGMFSGCSNLESADLRSVKLNTSQRSFTDLSSVFFDCENIQSIIFGKLNTSVVSSTGNMFSGCKKLTTIDLSGGDTDSLTTTIGMFYGCSLLKTIYVSQKFVTNKVTSSHSMFEGCESIVGGNETTYDPYFTDVSYARIDKPGLKGYFTEKI